MKSHLDVEYDSLNGLNANKKAGEINSFPEHVIFYHISPFDLNFRIWKKYVKFDEIDL